MDQATLTNWKTILEAVHAGSTVLIPLLVALGVMFRKKLRQFVRDETTVAIKEEVCKSVALVVDAAFEQRTPELKKIARDANDDLLVMINGTYVRSKEQKIRDDNAVARLDKIETKIDTLIMLR
jgi:hypothetical protein